MASVENANPTILNAAQLPSRQRKQHEAPLKGRDHHTNCLFSRRFLPLSPPLSDASSTHSDDSDGPDDDDGDGDFTVEPIDEQEIFDLISTISDPEHPLSLGQLAVVNLPDIHLSPRPAPGSHPDTLTQCLVKITPTITHCSLATVIGLGIRVRLEQALPPNYRVDVVIKEGTHNQDDQVNKQLADKERVAAALENDTLKGVLDKMLSTCV